MNLNIFTIGHSTHSIERLIALLRQHGVTALADVRSAPYSRRQPQFNREALARELEARGIRYVYLGKELGGRKDGRREATSMDGVNAARGQGRPERPARQVDGGVDVEFDAGIERLVRGAGEYTIAMMCAEKDPADCHRTHLVAPALMARGIGIRHILAEGEILEHGDLLAKEGRRKAGPTGRDEHAGSPAVPQGDLFS
jgi:uncharacterized protein (DUF488 family)